eukprot:TRINITY_DN626_c1_g1_i3.p1 TRINITY_DN626_c1_g1~~TRINITY_DN626_c1_g1_i3.p1  ORF type:complete len:250 (-),score=99.72 TRINITY_DN626_c1_g1_i3:68-817(-)
MLKRPAFKSVFQADGSTLDPFSIKVFNLEKQNTLTIVSKSPFELTFTALAVTAIFVPLLATLILPKFLAAFVSGIATNVALLACSWRVGLLNALATVYVPSIVYVFFIGFFRWLFDYDFDATFVVNMLGFAKIADAALVCTFELSKHLPLKRAVSTSALAKLCCVAIGILLSNPELEEFYLPFESKFLGLIFQIFVVFISLFIVWKCDQKQYLGRFEAKFERSKWAKEILSKWPWKAQRRTVKLYDELE